MGKLGVKLSRLTEATPSATNDVCTKNQEFQNIEDSKSRNANINMSKQVGNNLTLSGQHAVNLKSIRRNLLLNIYQLASNSK